MGNYILKRLLLMIPTLIGIMTITFITTQFVPGGPVEQLIHQIQGQGGQGEASGASAATLYRGDAGLDNERIAELKQLYGFDKPVWQRYTEMLGNMARMEFGESYYHHKSVSELVIDKLPVSISLGVWTFLITYIICIPLGITKAIRDGSRFDVMTTTAVLVGYAIPGFVLAITMLVLFGGGSFWDIFPLRGLVSDNWDELPWYQQILDYLWHMVLPIISMAIGGLAVTTLLTKNSFLEEIRKQYVLTAYAKGQNDKGVLYGHVFRNAIIPILTAFPAQVVAAFFTGSLLIEKIFSLDGIGLLSFESIIKRDYPVVMGTLYFFTLLGLLAKLITDLSYAWVDPRIKFGGVR